MDNFLIFEGRLPAKEFLLFEETVGDLVESLNWEDGIVKGMAPADNRAELDARSGMSLTWSRMETVDWLEEDEKKLPPITVGNLFIYTPHYTGPVPEECIPLQLRSSYAFGSGHHPTTEGCLEAIQALPSVNRALDIGCGSGILGLAVEALFKAEVIGTEIDERSAEMARENADGRIEIVHADGVSGDRIVKMAPFDLIVSNIHSGPLVELAPSIVPLLAQEGVLILAGLLEEQRDVVEQAYTSLGLSVKEVYGKDPEWPVLVLG